MRAAGWGTCFLVLTLIATGSGPVLAGDPDPDSDPGARRGEDRSERARARARAPRLALERERGADRREVRQRSRHSGSEVDRTRQAQTGSLSHEAAAAVAEKVAPALGDDRSGAERRRVTRELRALIDASRSGLDDVEALIPEAPHADDEGMVRVDLLVAPAGAARVEAQLEREGARRVSVRGARITASLPFANLASLEEISVARRIALAQTSRRGLRAAADPGPRPFVGNVLSEGVPLVGAPIWQDFDARGRGLLRDQTVSVAILDIGFLGFESLQATELPPGANIATLETTERWDIEGCLPPGSDDCVATGTALAEIVTDLLPRVDLHLISIDPEDPASFAVAVDYLLAQNVDLALGASIWSPGFYGDGWGEGPYNAEIERAVGGGVMWVNDIGDLDYLRSLLYGTDEPFARWGHWMGQFVDEIDHNTRGTFERDGYMDVWFDDQDPREDQRSWLNGFCLGPGEFLFLDLVWDDWVDQDGNGIPSAGQDYRFDIWRFNQNDVRIIYDTSSAGDNTEDPNFQDGEEGDYPWDTFGVFNDGDEPRCYYMSIFRESNRQGSDNRFHLYWAADSESSPGSLSEAFEPPGSIPAGTRMIPTDTAGVVGVGTSTLNDPDLEDDSVAPFNPNGILAEGVPSVCAPANVSTASFPFGGFLSSFSTAHAVGSIALLMNNLGFVSAQEALDMLEARARDITGDARDTSCGFGRLCTLTTGCPPPPAQEP